MVTAVMAEARVGRWHKLTRSGWSWLGQAADIVVVMPVQPSAVRAAARHRSLVVLGLLRALATAVVLVGLYYLLPLDHLKDVPLTLRLPSRSSCDDPRSTAVESTIPPAARASPRPG
jgi:hypothetical protein